MVAINNLLPVQTPTAVAAKPAVIPSLARSKIRAPTLYTGTKPGTKPSTAIESDIDSNNPLSPAQAALAKKGASLIDTDNRQSGGALSVLSNVSTAAPAVTAPAATTTQSSVGVTDANGKPMITTQPNANAALAAPAQTATPTYTPAVNSATQGAIPALNGRKSSNYQNLIDPTNDTVEGRTAELLKSGNPLLEQAKTNALQSANARGLLNSSIGVEAGEQAVLNQAENIATKDAAIYNTQRQGLQEMEQSAWNTYMNGITNLQLAQMPEEDKKVAMDNINSIMKGSPHMSFVNTWRSLAA